VFDKLLRAICAEKGIRFLKELELAQWQEFRSTWKVEALTRNKRQGEMIGFIWNAAIAISTLGSPGSSPTVPNRATSVAMMAENSSGRTSSPVLSHSTARSRPRSRSWQSGSGRYWEAETVTRLPFSVPRIQTGQPQRV
jgi:hypothetical protein